MLVQHRQPCERDDEQRPLLGRKRCLFRPRFLRLEGIEIGINSTYPPTLAPPVPQQVLGDDDEVGTNGIPTGRGLRQATERTQKHFLRDVFRLLPARHLRGDQAIDGRPFLTAQLVESSPIALPRPLE